MIKFVVLYILLSFGWLASANDLGPSWRTQFFQSITFQPEICDDPSNNAGLFERISSYYGCKDLIQPQTYSAVENSRDLAEQALFSHLAQDQANEASCEYSMLTALDTSIPSTPSDNRSRAQRARRRTAFNRANRNLSSLYPEFEPPNSERPSRSEALERQKMVLGDIQVKLPEMQKLYSQWNALDAKVYEYEQTYGLNGRSRSNTGPGFYMPPNLISKEEYKNLSKERNQLRQQYDAVMASIWMSHRPEMQNYVESFVKDKNYNPSRFTQDAMSSSKKYSFQSNVISKLKKQSRSQLHSLANMGNDYSDGFKIQAQNAGLTNHYVNQLNQQSPQDYSSLQCQLEDRYGKTRKTAGQAFYWGGQAAMLVATGGASIWVQGLANAAKAGAMAVNSARIMSALRIPNASVARGATTMTTGTDSAAGTTAAATAGAATEATLGAASSSTSGAASSTAVRTAASSNLATAGAVASLDVMNAYISDCVGSNTVDSFRQNICKNLNGDTTELLKKDLDTSNCALGITLSALGTAASPLVKAFKRQRQLGLASKSKSGRTDTWPGMSTGERIIMNRILNRNVDSYNEALQAGHAQTRFLQELGFQITPNRINAPDISTALNGVDDKIDELIAAGKIKEDEVLRPVVPYETPNGSIVFARPGTELPEGSTHLTRLLTREQMAYLIERGYFPVGAPNHVVDGGTPALVHDLGHFGAFIDNPDVMASMRRNYSEALNAQGTALELQNIQYRHAYIMENLVLSTPERVNGLNGILRNNGSSLRLGNDEDFIQLSTIQRSVDQMSPEQVDTAIRQITERPASELRFIGGGTRDVRWVYDQANSSAEAGIRSIEEYESVFRNPNFGLRNDIDERREALANYLYISEHTRNLSTRDLYRGINNSGPVDQSPFRQLVCSDSGYSTTLFGIFC